MTGPFDRLGRPRAGKVRTFLRAVACSAVPYWMCAGKLTAESRGRMMLTRSTKPSAKPLLVLVGVGLGLLLVAVVVVVAVTRKNNHDSWPGQGTKWEGTLASTVFALDAQTGRIRWQRYLPEGPHGPRGGPPESAQLHRGGPGPAARPGRRRRRNQRIPRGGRLRGAGSPSGQRGRNDAVAAGLSGSRRPFHVGTERGDRRRRPRRWPLRRWIGRLPRTASMRRTVTAWLLASKGG